MAGRFEGTGPFDRLLGGHALDFMARRAVGAVVGFVFPSALPRRRRERPAVPPPPYPPPERRA
ncbi:hypothetical protein [Streptomyces sp. NPDC006140]|uniref:hypothetical protein n=1 Tax=Streptomyces sp. NPDC006140 TaxID=3154579 RepID=UPI0033F16179